MSPGPLTAVLRRIHQAIGRRDGDDDGRLLERFAAERDEAAFEALVKRHGPMVLAVGRRALPDANDAEDVFQAAFLVLARKAGALRSSQCLAAWLHRTATRLALALREETARRRQRERQAAVPRQVDPSTEAAWRDLRPVLDAELSRLPDRYRLPLVLCCLEDKTQDEAARQLGWPRGSVAGRLSRARELLRARLVRRGITLTAAALAALLAEKAVAAAVPAGLARSTIQVAAAFAAGAAATTATISGKGAALAEATLKGALATPVKVGAVLALALVVSLATAAGLAALQPPPPAPAAPPAPAPAASPDKEDPKPARADLLGDPLPDGAEVRLGTVRLRHASMVLSTVFAADGKTLWAADVNEGMHLWDVETGRPLGRIALGTYCYQAAMTPDRTRLVADNGQDGSKCGTFLLWDVKADKEIRRFGKFNPNGIDALAISPDGKTLASSSGVVGKAHEITLWDADSGRELRRLEGHSQDIDGLLFTPDGEELVSAGRDGSVRIWDVENGKKRLEVAQAFWAVVSPDGKTLAAVNADHSVRLIDPADGKERCHITGRHGGGLAFTPDSRFLVAADSGGDFIFWDADTGKSARRFPGSEGRPQSLSFSPDGRTLAIGGVDHCVCLFDVQTGKERNAYTGHRGAVVVAFSPDGKTAATAAGDGTVRLWDPRSGEQRRLLRDHKEDVLCVAFSPDGKLLATGGGPPTPPFGDEGEDDFTIRLWDANTGQVVRRLKGHEGRFRRWRSRRMGGCWSPVGKRSSPRISTTSACGTLRRAKSCVVSSNPTGYRRSPFRRMGRPWRPADTTRCPSGTRPTASRSGRWAMGCRRRPGNTYRCVAFAPDGRTVVAGLGDPYDLLNREADALQVWDASTGERLGLWPSLNDSISAVAFSRDGKTLAVASEDKSILLLDTRTGREFRRWTGHIGVIRGLAFAPDGQTLLSGSDDGTALIWDVTGRRENGKLPPIRLTAEQLAARWDELADADPDKARPALWELVAAAETSVPFLGERLTPVTAPDPARLARLLTDLDDDDFAVRERASAELQRLGEGAAPAVRKALEQSPPEEARRRMRQALDGWSVATPDSRTARQLRAVEVLEHVGSTAARDLLQQLADGAPGARLTREAKAALERLSSGPG